MGNEILAAVLWGISIPVVIVVTYVLVFFLFIRNMDKKLNTVPDGFGSFLKGLWPIAVGWLVGVIWCIIAVSQIIVHAALAIQIGAA